MGARHTSGGNAAFVCACVCVCENFIFFFRWSFCWPSTRITDQTHTFRCQQEASSGDCVVRQSERSDKVWTGICTQSFDSTHSTIVLFTWSGQVYAWTRKFACESNAVTIPSETFQTDQLFWSQWVILLAVVVIRIFWGRVTRSTPSRQLTVPEARPQLWAIIKVPECVWRYLQAENTYTFDKLRQSFSQYLSGLSLWLFEDFLRLCAAFCQKIHISFSCRRGTRPEAAHNCRLLLRNEEQKLWQIFS